MYTTQYRIDIEALQNALGIARAVLVIYPDGGLRLHPCGEGKTLLHKEEIAKFLSDKVDEYYDA